MPAVNLVRGDIDVPEGPVILRVHDNDPRSAECAEAERALCEAAIVVDAVVWAGDEWTRTAPRTIEEVARLLDDGGVAPSLGPVPRREPNPDCQPDQPPMSWQASSQPSGRVLVFASVAERQRVGPISDLGGGGRTPEGITCVSTIDGLAAAHWIEWDNVLVEVPYLVNESQSDVDARVGAVRAALGLD
jgi:hypothetical protein